MLLQEIPFALKAGWLITMIHSWKRHSTFSKFVSVMAYVLYEERSCIERVPEWRLGEVSVTLIE